MVSLACVHTQTSCTCGHQHLDSTEVEGSLAVVRARINVGASVHQEPHDLASTDTHVTCIWRIQTHMTHVPAPASTKSPTLWRVQTHISIMYSANVAQTRYRISGNKGISILFRILLPSGGRSMRHSGSASTHSKPSGSWRPPPPRGPAGEGH